MKIDKTGGVDLTRIYGRQIVDRKPGEHPRTEGAEERDSVELSDQARELQAYRQKLAELPAVRTELVERLKAEIQAGTYDADAEKIAAGLVREWGGEGE
ncbi:flagellar biosynthesis anti-sigma factor FlgM [Candidatus Desulforudis audaxviator]|uniref:Negative regulator of flagellin synthesis n=1 Tax=Desulforudis audaxviator (strain MP104C) TaxID=477974 RepID=B1I5H8_DESAP|nr:flagellar biosynthesis anti-sigma factor FlgM [Candidatus Desulforudis audaxviator]ACA60286.1 anti-sigma-28 factor, FlgM [Candidatus Desulforudis audaxviator MP104C]AZK60333.1 anti-sigma-28 factor, FlgM [Candidatus Desulforudis audaxviator]